ncbi:MAG: GntR family transcriptional regulator [Chloroflexi bacterium]|nr:GntR family transcriptional regulator [Chloroflexota bacterium]
MLTEDLTNILLPPQRCSLADEVTERLRQAILSGQLAPGQKLRENVLAESMSVSRGPIREALRRLEREGLVIRRHNRSAFVARLSRHDLDEVYSLRLALERLAVQLAIRNSAAKEEVAEMQATIDTMAAYIERGITEQEAAELDMRFHDALYRASHHQRLQDSWATLRPQVHILLLSRNVADPDFRDQAVGGHQEVLDAIRNGDEARATAIIEQHLQAAYDRVLHSYRYRDAA